MSYLKHPAKVPEYRQARSHLEFICKMKDYMPRSIFIDKTIDALNSHFILSSTPLGEAQSSTDPKFEPPQNYLLPKSSKQLQSPRRLETSTPIQRPPHFRPETTSLL
ncbi:unnamed protein product [Rhodiola kirilowii]